MKKRTEKKMTRRFDYKNYRDYKYFLASMEVINKTSQFLPITSHHIVIDFKFKGKKPTMCRFKYPAALDHENGKIYIMRDDGKSHIPMDFARVFSAVVYNLREAGLTDKELIVAAPN